MVREQAKYNEMYMNITFDFHFILLFWDGLSI